MPVTFLSALLDLTGSVVARAMITLGLGVVTITGLDAVLSLVVNQMQASFSGLPAAVASIVFMSGLPQGLAVILSALSARIGLMQLSKIQIVK